MATVTLLHSKHRQLSHGGEKTVDNYEIYLGKLRLRGFSTHGNMSEGYWGSSAKPNAEAYAKAIANELGVCVIHAKKKGR